MNANELANEIMEHYKAELPRGFNVNWMQEAATMLRAQQAEIEALKYEKSSGVYDDEPVAWMLNGNTLEDFLQTSKEVDEYDNLDCRILAADSIRQLVYFVSQQQAEIEFLKLQVEEAIKLAVTEIQKRPK